MFCNFCSSKYPVLLLDISTFPNWEPSLISKVLFSLCALLEPRKSTCGLQFIYNYSIIYLLPTCQVDYFVLKGRHLLVAPHFRLLYLLVILKTANSELLDNQKLLLLCPFDILAVLALAKLSESCCVSPWTSLQF